MSDFVVAAVRYTADPPALARFLETLGLTRRESTADDGYVDLRAGDSIVLVHRSAGSNSEIAPGGAQLCFEVSDLDDTLELLDRLEFEALVWDESYGRHAAIRDPRGDGIWISEGRRDRYGYRPHADDPNDMQLVAVRATEDVPAQTAFYARLGFAPRCAADRYATTLEGTGVTAGVIGQRHTTRPSHPGPPSPDNPASPPALITLSFETREPLPALADRLRGSGVDAHVVPGQALTVTDPDGVDVVIRPVP